MVENSGGKISVESSKGKGSEFRSVPKAKLKTPQGAFRLV
jgi:hypothetical protein